MAKRLNVRYPSNVVRERIAPSCIFLPLHPVSASTDLRLEQQTSLFYVQPAHPAAAGGERSPIYQFPLGRCIMEPPPESSSPPCRPHRRRSVGGRAMAGPPRSDWNSWPRQLWLPVVLSGSEREDSSRPKRLGTSEELKNAEEKEDKNNNKNCTTSN
ncbi:uncharacterized protein LOC118507383 [Anopheles stephensi]|uniref:uncharacterized protein LOC118507383 n=1 Tax=Anopheles stephensi TaxID=30069 RepID=UPI001658BD56|nr:uncharacterized protein LOC118507383 [Anopheles stephensi]XP_035901730.1 uncharacterized protein LOC118507383 [Anopheles stephensi]